MSLARRQFLKLMGAAGAAAIAGCDRQWAVPERLVALALRGSGIERHVQTVCGLCEGGCGLTIRLVDDLPVGLRGAPQYPLNRGGLCPVGQAGLEVLYAPERVRGPLVREDDGRHRTTTWEEALGGISQRLTELRAANEGDRVAIVTEEPGQLFHELAERFAHAMGSASISRPGAGRSLPYFLTQGIDEIPAFDLGRADLVLSFGLDVFEDGPAPIHTVAAMVGSRPTGERCPLIHVGTRLSPTAAKAEEHLRVDPATHGALALGIAHVLVREGNYDRQFVSEHTFGFHDWTDDEGRPRLGLRRLLLERYYPDRVAQICKCDASRILHLARRFAAASTPVAVVGGEALESTNATWNAMAVHSLNALIGAFERPGGVVLPQPTPFTPLDPLEDGGWDPSASVFAPAGDATAFGADPIDALADHVLGGSHPIEILFLVNSNPVHSSPVGDRLRRALDRIPLVVAMTPFRDETAALADVILPTPVFLESWQESTPPPTVAMSVLGLSHPAVEPLFDTRHPGDILLGLSTQADHPIPDLLPWNSYVDYLKYRLAGIVVSGQGAVAVGSFEESWVTFLEERGWRFLKHGDIEEFWEDLVGEGGWWNPVGLHADWGRVFQTPSGRFEFFSQTLEQRLRDIGETVGRAPAADDTALSQAIAALGLRGKPDEICLPHYEPPVTNHEGEVDLVCFRPITARGRLGVVSPMVLEMFGHSMFSGWTTWIEIAPSTAHELGLEYGDRVEVGSDRGSFEAVVRTRQGATPGIVHVPVGLGDDELNRSWGGVGSNPYEAVVPERDPLDGLLSLNPTRVSLRLVQRRLHGGPPPHEGGHV